MKWRMRRGRMATGRVKERRRRGRMIRWMLMKVVFLLLFVGPVC
jgi:hypothetical protein